MIVGFDNDDARIFEEQVEFISQTDIMHAMVGMLSAIPKTPLHARLKNEGRLDLDDEQTFGTNVIPLNMSRDELRDGYIALMRDLYDPDSYFERLESLYLTRKFDFGRARNAYLARASVAEAEGAAARRRTSFRPVPAADEERARPALAAGLSASDDDDPPEPTGSGCPVRLRGQVRNALPPLHDVAGDVRTPNAGQHVLTS